MTKPALDANAAPETLAPKLTELIADRVLEEAGGLTPRTNLFEAGLDSMAIMQLTLVIEDEFGLTLEAGDLTRDHFTTAADLARLIHQRAQTRDRDGSGDD